MPRILPPPTRYDPLRLAQAKAAAPAAPTVTIPPTRFDPPVQHAGSAGTIQRATGGAAPAARSFAIPPTRYDPGVRHQPTAVVQRAAAAGAGAGGGSGSGGGQPPRKPALPDSKTFYKAGGKPGYGAAAGGGGKTGYEPPPGKADHQPAAAAGGKHHQFGSAAAGGKGHRPSAGGGQARHWNAAGGAAYYPNAAAGNSGYYSGAGGGRGKYRRGGYNSRAAANPAGAAAGSAAGGAAAPAKRPDTMAEAFARGLTLGEAKGYLAKPVALIGTDKPKHSPLYDQLIKEAADCLSIWLVHEGGEPHDNDKNLAWLDRCIKAGKSFLVVKPADHGVGSYAEPKTAAEVRAANPIQTAIEIGYLMHNGYKWDDVNTFNPPK